MAPDFDRHAQWRTVRLVLSRYDAVSTTFSLTEDRVKQQQSRPHLLTGHNHVHDALAAADVETAILPPRCTADRISAMGEWSHGTR
jgi:hypothetical protein